MSFKALASVAHETVDFSASFIVDLLRLLGLDPASVAAVVMASPICSAWAFAAAAWAFATAQCAFATRKVSAHCACSEYRSSWRQMGEMIERGSVARRRCAL
jgi:hypothetical protein